MPAKEPGILPGLLGVLALTKVAVSLTPLNDQGAAGGPVVAVSRLVTTHIG